MEFLDVIDKTDLPALTDEEKLDEQFMKKALIVAAAAERKREIPVGAVVVHEGRIIASGHNLRVKNSDATAHAEVVALRRAGKKLGRWNLADCDLYVTLEPCAMCAGAIVNARIRRVVFGAFDARFGCCGTLMNLCGCTSLNHRAVVIGGVLSKECATKLSGYFKKMRLESKGNSLT